MFSQLKLLACFGLSIVFAHSQDLVCQGGQEKCIYPRTSHTCFSPWSHICCQGVVHNRTGEQWTRCCGDRAIDERTQLCCNSAVYNKTEDRSGNMKCCGNENLYTDIHTCCELSNGSHKVHNKDQQRNKVCCGLTLYDPKEQLCCQDGSSINLFTLPLEARSSVACCRDRLINVTHDTCEYIPLRRRCSRTDVSEICCQGVKHQDRGESYQCCGTDYFSIKGNMCCEGRSYQNITYNGSPACCGTQLYNRTSQYCFKGMLHANSHGTGLIDLCGNQGIPYNRQLTMCCAGSIYSNERYICCSEHTAHLRLYGNDSACCSETQFNKRTHECASGRGGNTSIVPKPLCGGEPYSPRNSICCHNQTVSLQSPALFLLAKCCNHIAYRPLLGDECCWTNPNQTVSCEDNSRVFGYLARARRNLDKFKILRDHLRLH